MQSLFQSTRRIITTGTTLIGVVLLGSLASSALGQVFLPGNLVVSRYLNPTPTPNAAVAAPIFLDEYTTKGMLLNGTFSLPTPNISGTTGISGSFNSKSEGAVMRSLDGRYLSIMGYS